MNIHMGDKYLHIIFLFKEVYPYTSFPASLSPIIQSRFFQVHPAIFGRMNWADSYLWPFFLPSKMDNQVHCV